MVLVNLQYLMITIMVLNSPHLIRHSNSVLCVTVLNKLKMLVINMNCNNLMLHGLKFLLLKWVSVVTTHGVLQFMTNSWLAQQIAINWASWLNHSTKVLLDFASNDIFDKGNSKGFPFVMVWSKKKGNRPLFPFKI